MSAKGKVYFLVNNGSHHQASGPWIFYIILFFTSINFVHSLIEKWLRRGSAIKCFLPFTSGYFFSLQCNDIFDLNFWGVATEQMSHVINSHTILPVWPDWQHQHGVCLWAEDPVGWPVQSPQPLKTKAVSDDVNKVLRQKVVNCCQNHKIVRCTHHKHYKHLY